MESKTFAAAAVSRAGASFGVYLGLAVVGLVVSFAITALLGVFPEVQELGFRPVWLGCWAATTLALCADFRAHLLKLIELYGDPTLEEEEEEGDEDEE